jgi:hydroxymethylpyrimidine/phosphomethylpyrimidine kinase
VNRRVLVVGGLDPSGGAGVTADARALGCHGALALPVVTALTVQNRHGLQRVDEVPAATVRAMLIAAIGDGEVQAIKTGLLVSPAQIELLGELLAPLASRVPLVVDPVLSATAGGYTAGPDLAAAMVRWLLPLAAVATPNLPECDALAGGDVRKLLATGCRAVLLKGGHGRGAQVRDVLHTAGGERAFSHERLDVGAVHGSGCAYASAVAARLAGGDGVAAACASASAFLHRCLLAMGKPDGNGLPRPLELPV